MPPSFLSSLTVSANRFSALDQGDDDENDGGIIRSEEEEDEETNGGEDASGNIFIIFLAFSICKIDH